MWGVIDHFQEFGVTLHFFPHSLVSLTCSRVENSARPPSGRREGAKGVRATEINDMKGTVNRGAGSMAIGWKMHSRGPIATSVGGSDGWRKKAAAKEREQEQGRSGAKGRKQWDRCSCRQRKFNRQVPCTSHGRALLPRLECRVPIYEKKQPLKVCVFVSFLNFA